MKKELPAMQEPNKAKTQTFTLLGRFGNEPVSLCFDLASDTRAMGKRRLGSSDTVFRFEVPGCPSKAGAEAPHSPADSPSPSPGSAFPRWVPPVRPTEGCLRAPSSSPEVGMCPGERQGAALASGPAD